MSENKIVKYDFSTISDNNEIALLPADLAVRLLNKYKSDKNPNFSEILKSKIIPNSDLNTLEQTTNRFFKEQKMFRNLEIDKFLTIEYKASKEVAVEKTVEVEKTRR